MGVVAALVAARVAYVSIEDDRAVAAARKRCTPEQVFHVRQPAVWQDYLKRLPPTEPYGRFLTEQERIRKEMGIERSHLRDRGQPVLLLSNANGEIVRWTEVKAHSIAFSYDAPPREIYSCHEELPEPYDNLYAY